MIFRDDDIGFLTDVPEFKKVDAIFKKYGAKHTIAVIAKDIEKNTELCEYINANKHIDVQLHCYEHIKLTENTDLLKEHLQKGIKIIQNIFGKTPTILYPPWNETNGEVKTIAASVGLKISHYKISLTQYLRCKGMVKEDTINFHYWHDEDAMLIDPALRIYTEIKNRK